MDWLGFYPIWYVPDWGSATVIAIIATFHVLASHTSVGAAILLAYLGWKGHKENQPQIFQFIKKYLLGLLVFSYVSGSITGPGIWFSTTVANPRGISALIHNFVWVWAAEWIWFVAEVALVYILYYTIDRLERRAWLRLATIFALGSWATMYIIVGILSFMLSPGTTRWFETGAILDAFYNKNYFPHLMVRTSFMFALTGLLGLVVIKNLKNQIHQRVYNDIVRTLSFASIAGIVLAFMFFTWYYGTLPERSLYMIPRIFPTYLFKGIAVTVAMVLLYNVIIAVKPEWVSRKVSLIIYVAALVMGIYPEEKIRETLRKPYVAGEYVWVNQIVSRDVPGKEIESEIEHIQEVGLLKAHPFVPEALKTITPENEVLAGKVVAMISCSGCHNVTSNVGIRPLGQKLGSMPSKEVIYAFLKNYLSKENHPPYMPYFVGKDEELAALAAYVDYLNRNGGRVLSEIKLEAPLKVSVQTPFNSGK